MIQPQRSELKTGKRPVSQQTRKFKSGDTLFLEGSTARELFIIQEGRVGVFRDSPEGRIELAQIGPGGIVGEMSLLDNLPRSATVVALEEVNAIVIGFPQFQTAIESIPIWLQSIVKIVVSRLRDANRRIDQSIVRNRDRGFSILLGLLYPVYRQTVESIPALSLDMVSMEAHFICRLRRTEVLQLVKGLEQRSIVRRIEKDEKSFIVIPDIEVLQLYEEYLLLRDQKRTFKELSIPKESIDLLSNIVYIAQKSGRETEEGTSLLKKELVGDLSEDDVDRMEKHLMDLRRRNLINLLPTHDGTAIVFRKETTGRIKKIREWIPRFTMEIQ